VQLGDVQCDADESLEESCAADGAGPKKIIVEYCIVHLIYIYDYIYIERGIYLCIYIYIYIPRGPKGLKRV